MRLKARVEKLETYTANLDRKIENVKSYMVIAEDYKKLELKVNKQEEVISALIKICEPIILERITNAFGEIANGLKKALQDLFGDETPKKCKKCAKPSAEKCRIDGKAKTTKKPTSKKTSKKGDK